MSRDLERSSPTAQMYQPIEPYDSGFIDAGGGHSIYWEACGNPSGKPALFLHSGPGGGCSANNRRLFDPDRYRIVLFDQRGCGRSRPHASAEAGLRDNTTAHLVSDMEALRWRLEIDRWLLLGGSWGATLALAYAQTHPERVSAIVLRGVFTARQSELRWLYQEGASFLFPDAWERFVAAIPQGERGDMVAAYHVRLSAGKKGGKEDGDGGSAIAAARAWCAWEDAIMTLLPDRHPASEVRQDAGEDDAALLALARLEAHYFVHGAFLDEGQLIADAHRMRHIPGVIVQGRYDAVTPPATAWDLCRAWPQAELQIVPDAGHASTEPGILRRLIAATQAFACS
jgi:proline iminopeptidase